MLIFFSDRNELLQDNWDNMYTIRPHINCIPYLVELIIADIGNRGTKGPIYTRS